MEQIATLPETTAVPSPAQPLKIAILGTASSSLLDAPFKDESWKIWSLAYNAKVISRGDKWFEIHDENVLKELPIAPEAVEILRKAKSDLFAYNCDELFPDATPFPFELVLSQFPRRYFTSSIAWMLALAILTNPEEIGLYGVDMCDTDEYAFQKGACEYLVGYADAKGIKVTIAKDSPVCRVSRLYAYQDVGISRELVMRRTNLGAELERRKDALDKALADYHFIRGRNTEVQDISNRWR